MRLHHFRSHFIFNFDSSDPFHTYSCAFAAIVFCLLLISKSSIKSVTYNLGASVFTGLPSALHIEPQLLPRRRKAHLKKAVVQLSFLYLLKMNIVMKYFEAIDLFVMSIHNILDQKGFQTCTGQCFKEESDSVCSFFF